MTTSPRRIPSGSVETYLEASALLEALGPDADADRHWTDLGRDVGAVCRVCDQPARGGGLCENHYRRELRATRRNEAALAAEAAGTPTPPGTCAWCGEPLPTTVRAHTNKPRTYCSHACDVARRNKRDYYAEEVEFLVASGSGPAAIVEQLGVKAPTLLRSLERAGRPDLASIVRPLARRDKGSAA